MPTANGSLSSDDELLVEEADAEPASFTFQSDLSDDDAPDPLGLDLIASASLAAMNGTLEVAAKDEDEEQEKSVGNFQDAPTNGVAATSTDTPRKGAGSAIEVQLPWLSQAQRAGYLKVKVPDDWPAEDEQLRLRRRRRGVSRFFAYKA